MTLFNIVTIGDKELKILRKLKVLLIANETTIAIINLLANVYGLPNK